MHDLEFRRIEETARVQTIRRNEIAPFRSSERHVKAPVRRPETAIRSSHTTNWFCLAKAGTRRHLNHQTRLVTKFGRRRSGDQLQRLNRIDWDMIREDFARLIRQRLAIDPQ